MSCLECKLICRTEKQVHHEVPKDLDIHLIAHNCFTHKLAKVREWLGKHERFPLYCTPTSAWWMNWVERFFADLTEDCVREGSFASVKELVEGQCGRDSRQDSPGPPSSSSQWNHVTLKSVHKIGPEGTNRGTP